MENRYEITDEMMRNAKTYIPVADKDVIAQAIAESVCVPVENQGDEIAPVYRENNVAKYELMIAVLMSRYFGEGKENAISVNEEDVDGWCEAHVMNQIERFKQNPEFKTKAFDILQDFKDLEKFVNGQIYGILNTKNDVVRRLLESLEMAARPENLQQSMDEMNEMVDELKAKRDALSGNGEENGGH